MDRAFKLIFGREENKDLLIDLLNGLFEGERLITQLSFMNVEHPAESTDSRGAENLETLPFKGKKELFTKLERLAKVVNLNKKERAEYEESLKIYRDNQGVLDYALESGFAKGKAEWIFNPLANIPDLLPKRLSSLLTVTKHQALPFSDGRKILPSVAITQIVSTKNGTIYRKSRTLPVGKVDSLLILCGVLVSFY